MMPDRTALRILDDLIAAAVSGCYCQIGLEELEAIRRELVELQRADTEQRMQGE